MAASDEQGELTAEQTREMACMTEDEWAKWTALSYSFCQPRQNGLWGRKQAAFLRDAASGENPMMLAMTYDGQ